MLCVTAVPSRTPKPCTATEGGVVVRVRVGRAVAVDLGVTVANLSEQTIEQLINEKVAKIGEKIVPTRFYRMQMAAGNQS